MRKFIGVSALGLALVAFGSWTADAASGQAVTRTTTTQTRTQESTTETHTDRDRDLREAYALRDDVNARLRTLGASIRGLDQSYMVRGMANSSGTASVGSSRYATVAYARTRTADRRMTILDHSDAVVAVPMPRPDQTTVQEGSFTRTTFADGTTIIERR